jgi:hypothetical protein
VSWDAVWTLGVVLIGFGIVVIHFLGKAKDWW